MGVGDKWQQVYANMQLKLPTPGWDGGEDVCQKHPIKINAMTIMNE